jgi:hypothetical protein
MSGLVVHHFGAAVGRLAPHRGNFIDGEILDGDFLLLTSHHLHQKGPLSFRVS